MNKNLQKLKEEFGKFGSWALWEKDGSLKINRKNFQSLIKPNIMFVGLNASFDLRTVDDWSNYHVIKNRKGSSWRKEHCRKLAEVLSDPQFSFFSGAYMTDIIKNDYSSSSSKVKNIIDQKNKQLFLREIKLLSSISASDKFIVICIGDKSFEMVKAIGIFKDDIFKVRHYSSRGTHNELKKKICADLFKVVETANFKTL